MTSTKNFFSDDFLIHSYVGREKNISHLDTFHTLFAAHPNYSQTVPKEYAIYKSGETPSKCPLCSLTAGSDGCFNSHVDKILQADRVTFNCKICSYTATIEQHMMVHQRSHTGYEPYQCPQCPYTSTTISQMLNHIKLTHHHTSKLKYDRLNTIGFLISAKRLIKFYGSSYTLWKLEGLSKSFFSYQTLKSFRLN